MAVCVRVRENYILQLSCDNYGRTKSRGNVYRKTEDCFWRGKKDIQYVLMIFAHEGISLTLERFPPSSCCVYRTTRKKNIQNGAERRSWVVLVALYLKCVSDLLTFVWFTRFLPGIMPYLLNIFYCFIHAIGTS